MVAKEAKKISKIIDELLLYFLKKGFMELDMKLKRSKEEIAIIFKIHDLDECIINKMQDRIGRKRELEVEEYGWELMGESDCSNELELIGLLIDSFSYIKNDNLYELTFIRKY